jgi:hypothetical protein
VTTTPQPRPITIEDSRDHTRWRRKAVIIVVTAAGLTLAWLLSPVAGGIVTIMASVVLAAVVAPGPIDGDGPRRDFRNDVGW